MTTADILRTHNAWRRGQGEWADKTIADLPFTNAELGTAIDEAVRRLEVVDRTVAWLVGESVYRRKRNLDRSITPETHAFNSGAEHTATVVRLQLTEPTSPDEAVERVKE